MREYESLKLRFVSVTILITETEGWQATRRYKTEGWQATRPVDASLQIHECDASH
ncbi:hypothetical protein LTSESEN_6642 [Salmonella enterica subsp. enterica serovar Senftenberg str. A4-543]|uniref:Uncharacterized protein n=1 Tax=Salmonella enterica subsp. enterica serovar Senftenberg str. A4-543 TaxID=913082 RepID=G5R9S3_SALSE|nr:hypothetical protein LTSESEN_6642 [Salmonella enterica subsp. enterica serovar Senftenberg str. A4-543]